MSNGTDPLDVVRQAKSKREIALNAAIEHMRSGGRVPRHAVEAAIRAAGLTQPEVNTALIELYDQAAALGLVTPRA